MSQNILTSPKKHFFFGVKSRQFHFFLKQFYASFGTTTSFGIKLFIANQYVGKSMCAEATEKYQKCNPNLI